MEFDLIQTRELDKYLEDNGCYDSQEESLLKEQVLGKLEQIVKMWVKTVSRANGFNKQLVEEANAKIFIFGSYRIGIADADIGVLCVGPRHINHQEDFFITLPQMLVASGEVTELDALEDDSDASKLKFKLNGVSLNLMYASLSLWVIPDNFRMVLRAITLWAKRRYIFSDNFGFLGAMSWQILVARICQLYPNASPNMLVSRLFKVYSLWRWPNPVMLCNIEEVSLGLEFWDPRRNEADRFHVMPIITPSYPYMNCSCNVSSSTFRVIFGEFNEANKICKDMETNLFEWNSLFEPYRFFEAYKTYLQIDIVAKNANDLRSCKCWVESCLHELPKKIDLDTRNMLRSHPHPDSFSNESRPFIYSYFVGLRRNQGSESKSFDMRSTVEEF